MTLTCKPINQNKQKMCQSSANMFQATWKYKVINYPDEIHAGMDLVYEENHDNPNLI